MAELTTEELQSIVAEEAEDRNIRRFVVEVPDDDVYEDVFDVANGQMYVRTHQLDPDAYPLRELPGKAAEQAVLAGLEAALGQAQAVDESGLANLRNLIRQVAAARDFIKGEGE